MSNHTYKVIELVGSSTIGTDDAIKSAIAKASLTLKNLGWFEVIETRGHIENGKVAEGVVNDRGPYIKGRYADVSYALAQQLGFVKKGVTKLIIEKI